MLKIDVKAEEASKPKGTRKAVIKPRSEVDNLHARQAADNPKDADEDTRQIKARERALATLNRRLPQGRDPQSSERATLVPAKDRETFEPASSSCCRCLRRGGICTCEADDDWLRSKRPQAAKYSPPHVRGAGGRVTLAPAAAARSSEGVCQSTAETAGASRKRGAASDVPCTCLRRHGRCSCQADQRWLDRKRRCVVPYVPPHAKERKEDLEKKRAEIASKAELVETRPVAPNIRTLARRWEPKLERPGSFRFNPLQSEGQVTLCDDQGLEAECLEQAFAGQGLKAIPALKSGKYHFEVELLRDCAIALGWSSAMSPASTWDHQAFGYASDGCKVNARKEAYGPSFGKEGDVIGSLAEWKVESGVRILQISFMLNGRYLGVAFTIGGGQVLDPEPVPMQPHVSQLSSGLLMHIRLHGSAEGEPLAFPKAGFSPVAAAKSIDFCPFSQAVAASSTERTAASMTEEQLSGFCVPDAHIVELYDIPETLQLEGPTGATTKLRDRARELGACLAKQLGLPKSLLWASSVFVRETTTDSSTALVAFRRASHAKQLVEACSGSAPDSSKQHLQARPLQHATAASRERLRDWRGEEHRPQAVPTAARRLIHSSLQSQMPLAHLVEEKNLKSLREKPTAKP